MDDLSVTVLLLDVVVIGLIDDEEKVGKAGNGSITGRHIIGGFNSFHDTRDDVLDELQRVGTHVDKHGIQQKKSLGMGGCVVTVQNLRMKTTKDEVRQKRSG